MAIRAPDGANNGDDDDEIYIMMKCMRVFFCNVFVYPHEGQLEPHVSHGK